MDQTTPRNSIIKPDINYQHNCQRNDEIDLVSLWIILAEQKKVIFAVITLAILIGMAVIVFHTQTFTYKTSIEIGKIVGDISQEKASINTQFVEPINSALAKLTESYIPLTLDETTRTNTALPIITAEISNDSGIIILESIGTAESENLHIQIHNQIVQRLSDNHKDLLLAPRQAIFNQIKQLELELNALESPTNYQLQLTKHEEELAQAKRALAELTDPRLTDVSQKQLIKNIEDAKAKLTIIDNNRELIKEQLSRFEERKQLIQEEIAELQELISTNTTASSEAIKETSKSNESRAMTILLINDSIQKSQQRLSTLKEKLKIDLKNEEKTLKNQLIENLLAREKQQKQIDILRGKLIQFQAETEAEIERQTLAISRLELEIENFKDEHARTVSQNRMDIDNLRDRLSLIKDTHPIAPTATITNTPPGSLTTLAVSAMLGILAGILIAFLRMFIQLAHKRREEGAYSHNISADFTKPDNATIQLKP